MPLPWLNSTSPFPDPESALTVSDGAPGLLAAGGDLSPERLLQAYSQGIFPWFSEREPILWWSTDPRMVLMTDQFHISHSLQKTLRKIDRSMREGGPWQIRFDSAFEEVMLACAAQREGSGGTWISPEIIAGYRALHSQGYAHSSELWFNQELVGGAYGVSMGRMFYGESMFARRTDSSKVALAYLVHFLRSHGVEMIDCQQVTAHLSRLGGRPIPRKEFLRHLRQAVAAPPIAHWQPIVLRDPNAANNALPDLGPSV